ncbi:MAG: hypothetical protein MUE51_00500 [Thermoleophilia bacterium]|jgi:hypothetical protein|nr:hypothetical protein [Thermoleophilia bacterium]
MTADLAYAFRTPEQDLGRAVADYLAVSRGAHLYSDADAHAAAEQRAWDRLQALRARSAGRQPAATPETAGAAAE